MGVIIKAAPHHVPSNPKGLPSIAAQSILPTLAEFSCDVGKVLSSTRSLNTNACLKHADMAAAGGLGTHYKAQLSFPGDAGGKAKELAGLHNVRFLYEQAPAELDALLGWASATGVSGHSSALLEALGGEAGVAAIAAGVLLDDTRERVKRYCQCVAQVRLLPRGPSPKLRFLLWFIVVTSLSSLHLSTPHPSLVPVPHLVTAETRRWESLRTQC